MLQNPDRRIVFAIPYEERFTLVGTTDVAWDAPPGPARITAEEVDYLCASINRYFARPIHGARRDLELCRRPSRCSTTAPTAPRP
ncbi:hypothetical protein ACRAWD_29910 [Caulobacter segnis]